MSLDEFSVPTHVQRAISKAGYKLPSSMDSIIAQWHGWYTGSSSWYKESYITVDDHRRSRDKMSIKPARRVCREWASVILNEATEISCESPLANTWLHDYLDRSNFWPTGQALVEKGFALGTAAWALWFNFADNGAATMTMRRYDARMIVPLSWDEEGITECAFVTRAFIKGKQADQVQMHVLDGGTYHIITMLFIDGKQVDPEACGALADFDTECTTKTFGVFKPAIENTEADFSPYGMSVFADAVDAIKATDITFDALFQEIELTEVKVFMSDELLDVRDDKGKTVPLPKGPKNRFFRKLFGQSGKDFYEVFSPDIRIDPLKTAFNVALGELGDLTGFGAQYFQLDKQGGLKTATEVSSDNSALMRNIRKHENVITGALQDIITAVLTCARIHLGANIEEDPGVISVLYDDSIITDTQGEKNMALAEIAALGIPWLKEKYLVDFMALSPDEAKSLVPSQEVVDAGF